MVQAKHAVGRSVAQKEGPDKVTGRAVYTHDLVLPGMLWGAIVRSPYPHARIIAIDTSRATAMRGVRAVITGEDTPLQYLNFGPTYADRYPLAREKVRFFGEEVAAVAADTVEAALKAVAAIRVEYERLDAVFDPEKALEQNAPSVHQRPGLASNVAQHTQADWGGFAQQFDLAAHTVTGTFSHGVTVPICLETNAVVAAYDPTRDFVDIWAGTQAPYFVRKEIAHLLGVPKENVRVHSIVIGGGFGGKSQSPEPIGIASLLSRKAGRPVKIVLSRLEEFTSGKTDHAKTMTVKTGTDADGAIIARRTDFLVDNGAFTHMGPAYVSTVRQRSANLYRVGAAGFDGKLVYTNKVSGGSYRGMGAPQIIWAIETQIDELAEKLGKDPLQYRIEIANQAGDVTPQGFQISTCALSECLAEVGRRIGWDEKRQNPKPWRGVGVAAMINPSVGVLYPEGNFANVALELRADGRFQLFTQTADCGTWQNTVLAQFAAEELSASVDRIDVQHMDTTDAPDDLGSAASRVTFVTGAAAINAGINLKAEVSQRLATHFSIAPAEIGFADDHVALGSDEGRTLSWPEVANIVGLICVQGRHEIDLPRADPKTGYGHYAATYGFGAQAVEVEVDPATGHVRVLKVVLAQDVGRVINPAALDGQMHGGVVQGIGMALSEELIFEQGQPVNTSLVTYRVPRIFEATDIETIYIETNDPTGPYGAKAGGEHSINPTVAAIANAVANATGIRFHRIPMTPHRVLEAIRNKSGAKLDLQTWRRPRNLEIAAVRSLYPSVIFPALKRLGEWAAPKRARSNDYAYERPADLNAALSVLAGSGRRIKVIAGGTDLLTGIRQGIYNPELVVDISGLRDLKGIEVAPDQVRIGAATTLAELAEHEELRAALPGLCEALDLIATQQIRNVATIAGDLCQEKRCWFFRSALPCYKLGGATCPCYAVAGDNRHHSIMGTGRCAAPCIADAAPILTALNAVIVALGPQGTRRIPIEEFYLWSGETVLARDEIMTRIDIPVVPSATQAYEKYAQWRGDFPEASTGVRLEWDGSRIARARISLGGVAPLPMRARHAEDALAGAHASDAALRSAAERVVAGALPLRDNIAKLDMIVAVTERALHRARDRH
ncbi:MAG: molybdopterin cofactor-binding domain-containing protein [Burkholderiales bacterium]